MRRRLRRFLPLALLPLALLAAGCASTKGGPAPLRVGFVPDNPPFAYASPLAPGAKPPAVPDWSGIEPRFARSLADRLGTTPQFVAITNAADLLPALRRGDVDILMTGLPIRDDWRSTVEFSPPYLLTGLGILHGTNSPLFAMDARTLATPARLRNTPLRLAIPADSPEAAAYVAAHLPLATSIPVPDVSAAIASVLAIRADAALAPAPALLFHARAAGPDAARLAFAPYILDPVEIGWACRPGATHIRDAIRDAVPRWTADGTLADVLSFYLPTAPR